jgi:hypothetical protein
MAGIEPTPSKSNDWTRTPLSPCQLSQGGGQPLAANVSGPARRRANKDRLGCCGSAALDALARLSARGASEVLTRCRAGRGAPPSRRAPRPSWTQPTRRQTLGGAKPCRPSRLQLNPRRQTLGANSAGRRRPRPPQPTWIRASTVLLHPAGPCGRCSQSLQNRDPG